MLRVRCRLRHAICIDGLVFIFSERFVSLCHWFLFLLDCFSGLSFALRVLAVECFGLIIFVCPLASLRADLENSLCRFRTDRAAWTIHLDRFGWTASSFVGQMTSSGFVHA